MEYSQSLRVQLYDRMVRPNVNLYPQIPGFMNTQLGPAPMSEG